MIRRKQQMAAADASDTSDRLLGSALSVVKKTVTYTQSKSLILTSSRHFGQ